MIRRAVLVAACALAAAAPAHAASPPVQARAYLVLDASTGDVLASRDAHARLPIASITKLMTVLVALQRAPLERTITVDTTASAVGESTINLRPGERLTLRDLVKAALVQSANDAADAIADGVGGNGERFVALMNAKARALRLRDTHFSRPDGLDAPAHYSSAWDVTRLAQAAMRLPFVRATVRERTDTIAGGRTLHTWNDLLATFPGLLGVKTGHTGGAGWCQVAAAREPGTTIYATILGSPSRAQRNADLAALLRWGLGRYRVRRVIVTGRTYGSTQTAYGRAPVGLVASRTARHAVRVDRALVQRVVSVAAVRLPVVRGQRLGTVRVFQGSRLVGERPLVAARSVDRPGLVGRASFYARRTLKHLGGLFT